MDKTIRVEVLMPLPEGWGFCSACEMLAAQAELGQEACERGLEEYPPEWQAEFRRFSQAIFELSWRYGDSVLFRLFDPRSLQGFLKAIRHGVHRYPAFIVEGRRKLVGMELESLQQALEDAGASVQTESVPAD